jgi:phosphopantetheinyl transferase (holo-ACP synthase)
MFRMINGYGIDLITIARSARTSVEMIDRFYTKHLTAEMNIAQLQSGTVED